MSQATWRKFELWNQRVKENKRYRGVALFPHLHPIALSIAAGCRTNALTYTVWQRTDFHVYSLCLNYIPSAAICSRVVSRWMNQALALAFSEWQEQSHETRRIKKICGRAVVRIMHGKLAAAFQTWCANVTELQRQYGILRKVALRMNNALEFKAFSTWIAQVRDFRRQLGVMDRVRLHLKSIALCKAFATWEEQTSSGRRYMLIVDKVLQRWCSMTLLR